MFLPDPHDGSLYAIGPWPEGLKVTNTYIGLYFCQMRPHNPNLNHEIILIVVEITIHNPRIGPSFTM